MCRTATATLLLWSGTQPVLEVKQAAGRHPLSECLPTASQGTGQDAVHKWSGFTQCGSEECALALTAYACLAAERAHERLVCVRSDVRERTATWLWYLKEEQAWHSYSAASWSAGCPCAQESAVPKGRRVRRAPYSGMFGLWSKMPAAPLVSTERAANYATAGERGCGAAELGDASSRHRQRESSVRRAQGHLGRPPRGGTAQRAALMRHPCAHS